MIEKEDTTTEKGKNTPVTTHSAADRYKAIDLLQGCINRMAHNSFLLKGWCLTLLAAILALSPKVEQPIFIYAGSLLLLIMFWRLDAFFLRTEKIYRERYKWVINSPWTEKTSSLFDLDPRSFNIEVGSTIGIIFTETLRWFYGIPALILTSLIIYELPACRIYLMQHALNLISWGRNVFCL